MSSDAHIATRMRPHRRFDTAAGSSPAGGSKQPVARRQVIVARYMPNTWHQRGRYPAKRLRIQWPKYVQLITCPSTRSRRLLALGTWGIADGCRMPSTPDGAAKPPRGHNDARSRDTDR
jgi:hypothetical protein